MFKYSISMFWSDEDECYIATIPEFPGLSAHGATPEEVAEEARIAAELFVEDMEESGDKIPDPQVASTYSGQFRVRLPKSLHQSLAENAKKEGVSLNAHLMVLLAENIGSAKTIDVLCQYINDRFDNAKPGSHISNYNINVVQSNVGEQKIDDSFVMRPKTIYKSIN